MARDLETIIRISGEMDAKLRKSIQNAASSIGDIRAASARASDAMGVMTDVMAEQGSALNAAKKKYQSYVLEGKKGTKEAKALAKQIAELSGDLNKNKKAMAAAEKAADALDESMDGLEKSAKDAGDGFTVMKGAMANLVSGGISAVINMGKQAASTLYNLADSTQEYREDMGKLEAAWVSAGKTTELATSTYKQFYAVLGEEDRSVEAVNHLAKFVNNEQDMAKWTNIATGVWATFGDSLPIEGLTEAANETAKVGKLTGVLADALNWAGVNEEDFQKKLDAARNEQERTAIITETLNGLYSEAAGAYREVNGSIMDARLANSEYTDSLADIGEKIEPVTTAVKGGLAGMLGQALDLFAGADIAGFAERISTAFSDMGKTLFPIIKDTLPSLGGIFSTIITAVEPLLPIISTFAADMLPGLVAAIGRIVQAAAPIIALLGQLIIALLPGIMSLVDGLTPIITVLLDALVPVIDAIVQIVSALMPPLIDIINALMPILRFLAVIIGSVVGNAIKFILPIIQSLIGYFSSIISYIKNIFLGNWSEAWDSMRDIFRNVFDALVGIAKAPINAVISLINGVIEGINSVGFDIPDWVPGVGGQKFAVHIPVIPMLATGGFTDGVSIAGEAGTEAVISFDRAYRQQNLGYWAKAGRMLGATADDAGFSLSGSGGGTIIDMGGVSFSPNISINGKADRESVIRAIEDEYPEFLDLLENWLVERGVTVYA